MNENSAIVVTSISEPNFVLREIAKGSLKHKVNFILIGDVSSPPNFQLEGCNFFSLAQQKETAFRLAHISPEKHYCRKNIGYLIALQSNPSVLVETDDDNIPREEFWLTRTKEQVVPAISGTGWINAYAYFSKENIWPRGLPLDKIHAENPALEHLATQRVNCPIQQGLADGNPDVDAIYRLVLPLPQVFDSKVRIALSQEAWSPFNSQNTTWWPECYPLLYLPAYCSFRMTDIWRSFIAQRIAWINGWSILFHEATVFQERNEHNLMKNFSQEIPGYLKNTEIVDILREIPFESGIDNICANMLLAYKSLSQAGIFEPQELVLLDAWIEDLTGLGWPESVIN